ncbi:MAG: DUF4230 domain-containing protein [Acidimicrobiia bacterium]|nr:DUF4230 domain-containing protein [Acidimicrobiia bacterium]
MTQPEQSAPADQGAAPASGQQVALPRRRSGMDRIGRMIVIGLGIAALVLLGSLAYIAGKAAETVADLGDQTAVITGEGEFTRLGPVTAQAIRELSELTTVEIIQYTTIEKGDDRGWLNWATGDQISMFVVASIGAGVDLAELDDDDILAEPETGEAVVRLPAAEITYIAPDTEATHVYNRQTGVFTKGDPDLERAARLAAEEVLVVQALDAGLLERAETRAITVLEGLIRSLGYTDVTVVVGN